MKERWDNRAYCSRPDGWKQRKFTLARRRCIAIGQIEVSKDIFGDDVLEKHGFDSPTGTDRAWNGPLVFRLEGLAASVGA